MAIQVNGKYRMCVVAKVARAIELEVTYFRVKQKKVTLR